MANQRIEELAGTAVQLAYEYPGFGAEHVDDMFRIMENTEEITVGDLADAAEYAATLEQKGVEYEEAIKETIKFLEDTN